MLERFHRVVVVHSDATENFVALAPDFPANPGPSPISEAWMQMQGPNYASEFASRVNIPDMSALIPDFSNTLAPALTELSRNMSSLVAVTFPREQLESIQKMVNQTSGIVIRDSALESYAEVMRSLTPALESLAQTALMPKMQASISAMASSLATAVDTSRMQNLLATASAFRDELADEEDLDELTDQFFASHPDLAESLEEAPRFTPCLGLTVA